MLKYPLYDLLATVPSCVETTTLAVVLEIFEQQQCDRLVVLNQQQCPIGLLYSAHLASRLLAAGDDQNPNCLDLQQPVVMLGNSLILPAQTLPVSFCVEHFASFLRSQQNQINNNLDWVLIDKAGKFLGIVDSLRLLQLVARQRLEMISKSDDYPAFRKAVHPSSTVTTHVNQENESRKRERKPLVDGPLVQLLERLPWPLMLQTSTGEVVTQNPAWWQQLGTLKDPEGVRQQVEAILSTTNTQKKSRHPTETAVTHVPPEDYRLGSRGDLEQGSRREELISVILQQEGSHVNSNSKSSENHSEDLLKPIKPHGQENSVSVVRESTPQNTIPRRSKSVSPKNSQEQQPLEATASSPSSRCYLDSQLGTCTCVIEVQNGQERIWQFTKIPLDSPESYSPKGFQQSDFLETTGQPPHVSNSDLWLMLATDVTEEQNLCKELAAKNADLIQLNRLKDEFLACISHELKTPLTAVLGLSRLLLDQQLGKLNERQARYAGLIHQSGRHLMSVVNNILDLTRMETGQMDLTLSNVKIRSVCDRAISEAKTIHRESSKATHTTVTPPSPLRDHQFTISIEPGLDEIVADELRLRQMLVHLLSNAFKFTETGGEIGLWVNRWEGWITFTVWDTGIGIPEHQQHLIFQKFQQLENPLTRQHEGTGLGLVLTRALARLHGGDVSFLSGEGKGSQFTLLLPPSPPHRRAGEMGIRGQGDETKGGCRVEVSHNGPLNRTAVRPPRRQPETTCFNVRNQPSHGSHLGDLNISQPSIKDQKNYSPDLPPTLIPEGTMDTSLNSQTDRVSSDPVYNSIPVSTLPTHSNSLVLVVEAVARYIEDLSVALTSLGYRVVIARSGCEALEKARRLQPKVIFLNPLLPLLSGWDVLTLLKSDATTRDIPVVVTATRAEKERAVTNRADGFLSLPVKHQALTPLLDNLYATPEIQQQKSDSSRNISIHPTPLRILRLVNSEWEYLHSHFSLQHHRVVEVDDLDQAELLARVWRFDVVLLDAEMPATETYLRKLSQYPRIAALPLVTCDVATTQAASQIPELSVFPCLLTPVAPDQRVGNRKTDDLLSVLQIASGVSCPPSILVVDLTMLPDLPEVRNQQVRSHRSQKKSSQSSVNTEANSSGLKPLTISRGSEWFQALIQYLQTAGLKAVMGRSWAELLQQIRHQSVDLLLICLGDSTIQTEVYLALQALGQLPFDLPPVLVLDQRLNPQEVQDTQPNIPQEEKNLYVESIETVLSVITNQILPRSISMEDLLNQIHQSLNVGY